MPMCEHHIHHRSMDLIRENGPQSYSRVLNMVLGLTQGLGALPLYISRYPAVPVHLSL
jgi:hypothetical protein